MSANPELTSDPHRAVRIWLWLVLAMIAAMVIIGGVTRLTGSGLSMVEWHPLMGAVPPLSEAEWQDVFARYQESPQYQHVNHWMDLTHFKSIFFWEYFHRLFGRLVGVVFGLPFVYFLVRRRIRGRVAAYCAVAFVLGGAQGLLGWYMVKSGLVDVPAVSHYRLAAHLLTAFVTGMYVLWLALELRPPSVAPERASRPLHGALLGTLGLLLVQIAYGAFMAGKRAGHISSTFPDMNGSYGPGPFFGGTSVLDDMLANPAAIHWIHRALAWLLVLAAVGVSALAWREHQRARRAGGVLLVAVLVQLALGAGVVLLHVPTWLAVVHQVGAFVLLGCGTFLAYETLLLPRGIVTTTAEAERDRADAAAA